MTKIGVVGAGAFGTGLAAALSMAGKSVVLWGRDGALMESIALDRINGRYLPKATLPASLLPTSDFHMLQGCDAVLLVIPAQKLRGFLSEHDVSALNCPLVLCAKGVEQRTGKLQSEVLRDVLPDARHAVITGPGFAAEIAVGKPTALTLACAEDALGAELQELLSTRTLRLYQSHDVIGSQLGGALKNVYAIACGIVEGADLGESARAALLTRGFAELSRLAEAMGAEPETLVGLSGFGDLVLTCTSPQSRNFAYGYGLGRGDGFATTKTVEGIATAKATVAIAGAYDLDLPVARTVAAVLEEKMTIKEALNYLMSRPLKKES
jgi:glycerol-3-phosphate dehydrogenase (NAD(P)+)